MNKRIVGGSAQGSAPYVIELNLTHPGGLVAVTQAFFALWRQTHGSEGTSEGSGDSNSEGGRDGSGAPVVDRPPPGISKVSAKLYQAVLTSDEVDELLELDRAAAQDKPVETAIFKVWPDYTLRTQIDRSVTTVKVDAARRSYAALGKGITWAVIDSGIDAGHPHFAGLQLAEDAKDPSPSRTLHRDFTSLVMPNVAAATPFVPAPLTDEFGHGTHVAGIIAGSCPDGVEARIAASDEPPAGSAGYVPREGGGPLTGMAPECQLVSLKIIREVAGSWITSSSAVIAALEYLMTEVNVDKGLLRVHGVNLSIGSEWDAAHYAAGQSPLCQAVNALVASGVVAVVAAGNSGSTGNSSTDSAYTQSGSILEPGHAQDCITVGSTHRDAPHTFGVSWTSARGPTLDGRAKPDVVAPGEWMTSAATGTIAARSGLLPADGAPPDDRPGYAPQSGTSMATPHVSGMLAAFLSVRPEYIGKPLELKQLLCENATDLGRERYAQGAGLADLMRMVGQS